MDTYKEKISHLKALFHLAHADKNFTPVEATYINIVADRLGVDRKELEKFDGSEPVLELPQNQYKLYSLFHRLAIIIMIDGEVTESEKQYCFNLGIKMGLHPNAINDIIDHVIKNGSHGADPAQIMAIFKKYLS